MINRKRCVLRSGKVQKKLTPMSRKIMKKEKGVYLLGYIDYLKVRQHCLDPTDPMFPALHTCDCECEWLSGSMNQSCHWLYSFYPPPPLFASRPTSAMISSSPRDERNTFTIFQPHFFHLRNLYMTGGGATVKPFLKRGQKCEDRKRLSKCTEKKSVFR